MKLLILLFLFPLIASANPIPKYLQGKANKEYLSTLHKIKEIFPKKGTPQQLLMLASPYGILDIQPTKFSSEKDKNEFANFNLGVIGGLISNLDENIVSKLPELVLCHKDNCRNKRLATIKKAMNDIQEIEKFFNKDSDIKIVQRLDDTVYRVNNAFFTPTIILLFTPSDVAGFVPSAKSKKITDFSIPPYYRYTQQTNHLRKLMKQHSLIAIVQETDSLINVILGGISNNQWGFKITSNINEQPIIGKMNTLGFKYDDVVKLSDTIFYYQTN